MPRATQLRRADTAGAPKVGERNEIYWSGYVVAGATVNLTILTESRPITCKTEQGCNRCLHEIR